MAGQKNFFGAIAIMIGTAVGAGIFGIPYVMAQAGAGVGVAYLLGLALIMALTSLMYGEIVLRTRGSHQLTGYAVKYLGERGKLVALIIMIVGSYGSMIAYLIEAPNFLQALFGGQLLFYRLGFFVFVGLAIYIGLGFIVRLEKIMVAALLLVLAVFIFFGVDQINPDNYLTFNLSQIFLPYGVILFALGALGAIPDMKSILTHQRDKLKPAIIIGMIVPTVVYLIFSLLVLGVTGAKTTSSAILGLGNALGDLILDFGAVFGVLCMTTSFLATGLVLKEVYVYDFKINKLLAWFLVLFIPLFIVLADFLTFIQVLGMIGAVTGGGMGLLLIAIYLKARSRGELQPEYKLKLPKLLICVIALVYILGVIYEISTLV